MTRPSLPSSAAWRHVGAREGFEVLFAEPHGRGWRFRGCTAAVEEGVAWSVGYAIEIDAAWRTRRARVAARAEAGERAVVLEADGEGGWRADGVPQPELDGVLDVDLEASAFTNALPARRLALVPGARADAPAAYVRAPGLGVERLEQRYRRLPDTGPGARYDYAAPRFAYRDEIAYDAAGLVVAYPGIAVRVS